MTINDAMQKFLVQLEADGRSIHTRRQYERHIRLFAHWAHEDGTCGEGIESIDHEVVARFLSSRIANTNAHGGRKKATAMNCLRGSIKMFLSFLHRAGYIQRDPGRLIRRAICAAAAPRGLTAEEQERFLRTLGGDRSAEGKRDYALFHLMLRSGVRLGAAVALDVEDIDFEGKTVTLRSTKGDRPDSVFLSDAVAEHMREYLNGVEAGPVFLARGNRVSARHVQRRFGSWLERAEIYRKLSVHSLRHSFAQAVYDRTQDLLLTQKALRHRSITSTLVYAHADHDRLRRALG